MKSITQPLAVLTLAFAASAASAQVGISTTVPGSANEVRGTGSPIAKGNAGTAITFEGLSDLEEIGNYYDAGTGGDGTGPGPDLGIIFSDNALAIIDQDAGGTGNFGGEPSPSTIMFFLSNTGTSSGAVMNVPGGFVDGFSFFYSAINSPGSITVFDGADGTGNVLATLNLPVTASDGGDPTGAFSPLVPIGVSFTGTARSVDFGGVIDQIGFDNITIGNATPVGNPPAPAPGPTVALPAVDTWGLIIMALVLAGATFLTRGR